MWTHFQRVHETRIPVDSYLDRDWPWLSESFMRPDLCHSHHCTIISCVISGTQLLQGNFYSCVLLDWVPLESDSKLHQVELLLTFKHWVLRKQSVPTGVPRIYSTSPSTIYPSTGFLLISEHQQCLTAVLIQDLTILSSVKFASPNCYPLRETVCAISSSSF